MSTMILVIEDDPASSELMAYLLRAQGYHTVTASRGDEGLEQARQLRPDLVVCDIQLPSLDGYAIARLLKSDDHLRGIPLLAVTALAMVGDRDRVLAAGFDAYLTKPIDPQNFLSQIAAMLGRTEAPRSHAARAAPAPAPPPAESRATLLVIDDLEVNRQLKRSIFEPHGYRVLTAGTAALGLEIAHRERPTVIISDIGLPDGNGLDLLRVLKSDLRVRDIPVVIITSTHADPSAGEKSLALGAASFLIRPLDAADVLREIEAVIAASR